MSEMPQQIIVNPKDKALIVTSSLDQAFPDAPEAFQRVDEAFLEDPEAHLKMLEHSTFFVRTRSDEGAPPVSCSLLHGPKVGNELLVIFAPFSDGSPNSSAEDVYRYMRADEHDPISKSKAAPNSWNQLSKSGVMSALLQAIDNDMPVLTIFSPIPPHAYTRDERARFRHGDFTPAAHVTAEATHVAQERLHGSSSETQFDNLHIHGASLGASNAAGAAAGLIEDFGIRSLTMQELIIGPKNYVPDLAGKFFRPTVGEPSDEVITKVGDFARIGEPAIRKLIVDRNGAELAATGRAVISMLKYSYLKGLTDPKRNQTPADIERVAGAGACLAIVLAANSRLTQDTATYLPDIARKSIVHVRAENGHRVAHLIDEQVTPTVLLAAMNVARSRTSTNR